MLKNDFKDTSFNWHQKIAHRINRIITNNSKGLSGKNYFIRFNVVELKGKLENTLDKVSYLVDKIESENLKIDTVIECSIEKTLHKLLIDDSLKHSIINPQNYLLNLAAEERDISQKTKAEVQRLKMINEELMVEYEKLSNENLFLTKQISHFKEENDNLKSIQNMESTKQQPLKTIDKLQELIDKLQNKLRDNDSYSEQTTTQPDFEKITHLEKENQCLRLQSDSLKIRYENLRSINIRLITELASLNMLNKDELHIDSLTAFKTKYNTSCPLLTFENVSHDTLEDGLMSDSAIEIDPQSLETVVIERNNVYRGFDIIIEKYNNSITSCNVINVDHNGNAYGKLRINDQIIMVNSKKIQNIDIQHILSLLNESETIILKVFRSSCNRFISKVSEVTQIIINTEAANDIGICFDDNLVITKIQSDHLNDKLSIGSKIISINGNSISNRMEYDEYARNAFILLEVSNQQHNLKHGFGTIYEKTEEMCKSDKSMDIMEDHEPIHSSPNHSSSSNEDNNDKINQDVTYQTTEEKEQNECRHETRHRNSSWPFSRLSQWMENKFDGALSIFKNTTNSDSFKHPSTNNLKIISYKKTAKNEFSMKYNIYNESIVVDRVFENETGLKPGDQLLEINKHSFIKKCPCQVKSILQNIKIGKNVMIVVERTFHNNDNNYSSLENTSLNTFNSTDKPFVFLKIEQKLKVGTIVDKESKNGKEQMLKLMKGTIIKMTKLDLIMKKDEPITVEIVCPTMEYPLITLAKNIFHEYYHKKSIENLDPNSKFTCQKVKIVSRKKLSEHTKIIFCLINVLSEKMVDEISNNKHVVVLKFDDLFNDSAKLPKQPLDHDIWIIPIATTAQPLISLPIFQNYRRIQLIYVNIQLKNIKDSKLSTNPPSLYPPLNYAFYKKEQEKLLIRYRFIIENEFKLTYEPNKMGKQLMEAILFCNESLNYA